MKALLVVLTACLLAACNKESTSSLWHDFGDTSRSRQILASCQQRNSEEFREFDTYLQDIGHFIMENNPASFRGDFAPNKFCFDAIDDERFGGSAAHTGRIRLTIGMIAASENDAQVAAVIAHELAHVTMGHVYGALHPIVESQPRWGELYEHSIRIYDALEKQEELLNRTSGDEQRQIQERIAALNRELQLISDEMIEFASSILGSQEIVANWKEQEADEVGYELYLRAGFLPSQFGWFFSSTQSEEERSRCQAILAEAQNNPVLAPYRGTEAHPHFCWRLYNIDILEAIAHREDYAPFKERATSINILEGRHAQIRQLAKDWINSNRRR